MRARTQIVRWALVAHFLNIFGNLCIAQQPELPRIVGVEPNSGITTPGSKVMVVGMHFSPDSIVYFGGLQAREIKFVNASALQAVTPYLRPGNYKLDLRSGETIVHSDVGFTVLPAPADSNFDQAEELAAKGQINAAIGIFTSTAATHADYDVRAYAHYRAGQLYLGLGDYWKAGEEGGLIWDAKVSHGAHSNWRYRRLSDETAYSISESNSHDTDFVVADWAVKWDVTENPEPRFWRALMAVRFGKMEQAKADLKFVLAAEPENPSYQALAVYIGVLAGDKKQPDCALRGQQVNDARALALLGQAAYLMGDHDNAQALWARQAKMSTVGSRLDYLAGRKHLDYGQNRIGIALLAECVAVAPDSREGKEAAKLLADLANNVPH